VGLVNTDQTIWKNWWVFRLNNIWKPNSQKHRDYKCPLFRSLLVRLHASWLFHLTVAKPLLLDKLSNCLFYWQVLNIRHVWYSAHVKMFAA
jgi:hypothetical protein